MPIDGNGNYSLPPGTLVQEGETVMPSQHNPPFLDVASALSQVLYRSGVAPMTGVLNMNSNKIQNLGAPTNPNDAARLADITGRSRFLADKNGVGQTVRDEKITFTNEVEDTAGIYDPTNSRVTPKAGEVMILHASITAPLSENNWEVVLYKNGARFRSFMNGPLGSTGFKSGSVLAIVIGNGTDYYEVFLETTLTVGGFTVFGDPVQTWFEGWSI